MTLMAWDLRFVTLRPAHGEKKVPGPDGLVAHIPAELTGANIDPQVLQNLGESLREDWEPFAAVTLNGGNVLLMMRRPARGATPVVEVSSGDAGQYL